MIEAQRPAEGPPSSPEVQPQTSSDLTAKRVETGAEVAELLTQEGAEGADGAETHKVTVLPDAVRQELEPLIAKLQAVPRGKSGKLFLRKGMKDIAVRAAALLYEYSFSISELRDRTGVTAGKVRKYTESGKINTLSRDEETAIDRLKEMFQVPPRIPDSQRHDVPESQRKIGTALLRLLRKGNRVAEWNAIRDANGLDMQTPMRWIRLFCHIATRDLVPDAFPKPEVAEAEAPVAVETEAPVSSSVADSTADASVTQVAQSEPEAAPVRTQAAPDDARLAMIGTLIGQNAEIATMLREMDVQDPRVAACNALIGQNRSLMQALGIEMPAVAPVAVMAPAHEVLLPEAQSAHSSDVVYHTRSGARLAISKGVNAVVVILEGEPK